MADTANHINSDCTRAEIEAHLKQVLASPALANSKRCQDFLQFVVTRALQGEADTIKERTIATDVFGRRGQYEPSEDSVVRVKASELRKRMATYYAGQGAAETIRIELPLGSYVPVFHRRPQPEVIARPPLRTNGRRIALLMAGVLAAIVAVVVVAWPRPSAIDAFWAPVWKPGEPVILCLPVRQTYYLTGKSTSAFRENRMNVVSTSGEKVYQIPAGDIDSKGILVGIGDSLGLARLAALFTRAGRPYNIKIVGDVSFSDLRKNPAVLLGAFSSRWTMQTSKDLRFVFQATGDKGRIVDTQRPGESWATRGLDTPSVTGDDYAIVARVFDAKSGQVIVLVAGITTFGTQSAAEFITDTAMMAQFAGQAPRRWETRNIELVLRTAVIGKTPGKPQIIAADYW